MFDPTLNQLRWIVKVRHDPQPLYEPIAAFNHPDIAEAYAARCHRSNSANTYVVEELPEVKPAKPAKVLHTFPATLPHYQVTK
jgi:hypothetical protein